MKDFNSENDSEEKLRFRLIVKEARKKVQEQAQRSASERIDLGTTDYKELLIQALEEKYMTNRKMETDTPKELQEKLDRAQHEYENGQCISFDTAVDAIKWIEEL